MEHLVGETLEARLAKGPLPLEQTLEYAIQIADALDKAHRQGVVHRDLKPGNIMLVKSGAKLLDFGLAKLQAADTPTNLSALPTEQANLTAEGTILGTLQYMAPEQLEGKEADSRTDIFAFGAVVYEMATGKKAFEGSSQASLIAAIMGQEPRPMSELQPMAPELLDWVVKRCLAKDPDERWQSASDVMAGLKRTTEVGTEPGLSHSVTAPSLWNRAIPWGIAVVMALMAAMAIWNWTSPARQSLVRFSVTLPLDQRLPDASQSFAPPVALSPDGERLVYVGLRDNRTQLYMRDIHAFEAVPVPGTEGASSPFFSPDSKWLGFFANGKLQKVSMAGGAPLPICDVPTFSGLGVSWGSNATIIFSPYIGSGLFQVDASGGVPKKLTTPDFKDGGYHHAWPQILPDNLHVLFTVWGGKDDGLAVLSLETGLWRTLSQEITEGAWYVPSGHLIYGQAGGLLARPFDLGRLEPVGPPISILDNVYKIPRSDRASFAVSSNGSLAYLPGSYSERALVWVNRQGTELVVIEDSGFYESPHLSPDGKQVTLQVRRTDGSEDLWVYDLERGSRTRLTFQPSSNSPIWTSDGTQVTFASNRSGSWSLYWKSAAGIGEAEPLLTREHAQFPMSWSPDGKTLAFGEKNPNTGGDLWVLSPEGDTAPLLNSPFNEDAARFSPDGNWLAYVSNESGREEVYVQPYPGPGRRWPISNEGGSEPVWSKEGNELFYRNGEEMMAVAVETKSEFKAGTPSTLFKGRYVHDIFTDYDVSPDGQRFLMIKESDKGQAQIKVVLNWFEELKRLVPTN